MNLRFLSLIVLFAAESLFASIHPLTGSSIVNKPDNALAFAQMGFSVAGVPDYWLYTKTIESNSQIIELGTNQKTLLSFRVDTVSAKTPIETYVRQYLKDYNQYGFEVSGLQSFAHNQAPAIIVDLNQKNKTTRSRQMFFHKDNKMVIATCTDENARFDVTLKICNGVLSTFQWK